MPRTMDRTRWQQLSALLDEALALPAAERAAWLAAWRERDAATAEQLERMLAQAGPEDDEADGEAGAAAVAATPVDIDLDRTRPVVGADFEKWLGQALSAGGTASWPAPGADTITLALQRCGSWQLLHKIGEGGMGQVWLARRADGLYEAQAAIKLLRGDVRATRLAARFARERALLARLNHPAIARLLDAGIDEGRAFLVLEYVEGRALAEHVRANCPTVADRVRLMIRIAEGVEHAHAQLIVHRDLKPSNVLVTAAGEPKLLDFGIAGVLDAEGQAGDEQLTRQLGRMMTPAYAAPEQVKGEPIGIGADIFSLSVMLFELLSGELPFAPRDTDRAALEHALLHKPARRLTQTRPTRRSSKGGTGTGTGGAPAAASASATPNALPGTPAVVGQAEVFTPAEDFDKVRGDLDAIVAKGLRKLPEERYLSVRALITDLERWLSHRPVSVRRDDWRHRAGLWLRRNALVTSLAGGVTLALLAGLGVSTWQWRRAESAARQSELVTQYLGELLASASPDRNGGKPPTVFELMETSRAELVSKFAHEPRTALRLMGVLIDTYHAMNRFDIAVPLAEQRLALSTKLDGADAPQSRQARIGLARTYTALGTPARVVDLLAPLVAGDPGDTEWGDRASMLYMLGVGYAQLGRFEQSQRTLDQAFALVQQHYAPNDFEYVFFANYVSILLQAQGRLGEAEAVLAGTEPHWARAPKHFARFVLVLRRGLLNVRQRLGRFAGLEDQARVLQADIDALLGPGSDLAVLAAQDVARWLLEQGLAEQALAQQEDVEKRLDAAGVRSAFARLPPAVNLLLARTLAGRIGPPEALKRARELLEAIDREPVLAGLRRAEAWLALARVALACDDAWLAAATLERLRNDPGLNLAGNPQWAGRLAVLEGSLLRLQGNVAASLERLRWRADQISHWTDQRVMPAWQTALELACTLTAERQGTARAELQAALERADQLRPPALPAGHPLDMTRRLLEVRLQAPASGNDVERAAWQAVEQAWHRSPGTLTPVMCGLL